MLQRAHWVGFVRRTDWRTRHDLILRPRQGSGANLRAVTLSTVQSACGAAFADVGMLMGNGEHRCSIVEQKLLPACHVYGRADTFRVLYSIPPSALLGGLLAFDCLVPKWAGPLRGERFVVWIHESTVIEYSFEDSTSVSLGQLFSLATMDQICTLKIRVL